MNVGFRELMNLDIPESCTLSLGIRDLARRYDTMSADEYAARLISMLTGAVMELEGRLVVAEDQLRIARGVQNG